MAFKYRERSVDEVKKHATQQGGNYDSYVDTRFPMFKAHPGENAVRILPPTWDDTEQWGNHYGIFVFVHRGIGTDKADYICPLEMEKNHPGLDLGGKCVLCEARRELEAAGDSEQAGLLRPSKRLLAWVIDRNEESAGPKVWSMSWTMDKDISSRCIVKKTGELIPLDHPEEGSDVLFTREGTGLKTRYVGLEIDREVTPVHDKQKVQDQWLAFIEENPLSEILVYHEQDYIESVFGGVVQARDEDLDRTQPDGADGKPRRRLREETAAETEPATPRRRIREEAPAEQEEQTPPPRRALRRAPEPEPAAEAEQEEQSPPPRRARAAAPPAEEPEEQTPTPRKPAAQEEAGRRLARLGPRHK